MKLTNTSTGVRVTLGDLDNHSEHVCVGGVEVHETVLQRVELVHFSNSHHEPLML